MVVGALIVAISGRRSNASGEDGGLADEAPALQDTAPVDGNGATTPTAVR